MRKAFGFISIVLISSFASAATISFSGPWGQLQKSKIPSPSPGSTILQLTQEVLQCSKAPNLFNKDNTLMTSAFNLDTKKIPLGALQKTRAFGWCYTVNGQPAQLSASEVKLQNPATDEIKWYYCYSDEDKAGEWKPSKHVSIFTLGWLRTSSSSSTTSADSQ